MNETDAIEQLAALLDGTADRAAAPRSLTALLSLAETVRDESDVLAPSADFRTALRAELVAATTPEATLVERARAVWLARTSNLRASARVAVATMTASSMLGTAGMAVAAQEALPGDALYGIKTLTEQVRLMLATDALAEARLHLAFAAERLEELQRGAATMSSDEVVETLRRMDAASQAGADAMLDGAAAGAGTLEELRAFADLQRAGLTGLLNDLPLLAKPTAQDSLELLRRIGVNATGIVTAVDGPRDTLTTLPTAAARRNSMSRPASSPTIAERLGATSAITTVDCDCVDLPVVGPVVGKAKRTGGTIARNDQPDESIGEDEAAPEQEPPFEPTGTLTENETGGDDGSGGGAVVDGLDQLPLKEAGEAVGGATGVTLDTSMLDRLARSVDSQLGPLT